MKLVAKMGRVWKGSLRFPEAGYLLPDWFLEQKILGINLLEEAMFFINPGLGSNWNVDA